MDTKVKLSYRSTIMVLSKMLKPPEKMNENMVYIAMPCFLPAFFLVDIRVRLAFFFLSFLLDHAFYTCLLHPYANIQKRLFTVMIHMYVQGSLTNVQEKESNVNKHATARGNPTSTFESRAWGPGLRRGYYYCYCCCSVGFGVEGDRGGLGVPRIGTSSDLTVGAGVTDGPSPIS